MKEFTAACVQIAIKPNDIQANIEKGLLWLERARSDYEADLVVFPETVTTGYETGMNNWDCGLPEVYFPNKDPVL